MSTVLSFFYKLIRRVVIGLSYLMLKLSFNSKHLEWAIMVGDKLLELVFPIGKRLFRFEVPSNLTISIHGLNFSSPLTVASFKYHETTMQFWLDLGMGGGTLKTITKELRTGNQSPRIQEVVSCKEPALLNAMGLPGPGIIEFSNDIQRWKIWESAKPIGISLGGHSVHDYCDIIDEAVSLIPKNIQSNIYFELNISCPNTPDGQNISKKPELLSSILDHLRANTSIPCSVKVSPDQTNEQLVKTAKLCMTYDSMIINCGNTQFKKCDEVNLPKTAISIGGGGLSGDPLYERTLEMVNLLKPFNIPLIATGGITTIKRAEEVLNAGASLIGMATILVCDPFIIPKMNAHLSRLKKN